MGLGTYRCPDIGRAASMAARSGTYSLLVPETAAYVSERLGNILATPAGRFAELVVITELLQSISRGDNRDLEVPVRRRLARLLG